MDLISGIPVPYASTIGCNKEERHPTPRGAGGQGNDLRGQSGRNVPYSTTRQNNHQRVRVYSLTLGSKTEPAKRFKRLVTNEVLPSIRRQGFYTIPGALETVRTIEADAIGELADTERKEFRKVSAMRSDLAKNLESVHRGKMGGNALWEKLREMEEDLTRLRNSASEHLDRIWMLEQELADSVDYVDRTKM